MCDRCPELEERIAWLESELGITHDAREVDVLRRLIQPAIRRRASGWQAGGAVAPARALLALYHARGRVLSRMQIMDLVPPRSGGEDERQPQIVSVWISSIRAALGPDAVENAWGAGYRLSAVGGERVGAILA